MLLDIPKQDLRSRKTKKSLYDAMFILLEKYNFRKITIKDICDEALISRATFYSYFLDKYDLLKYWLVTLQLSHINIGGTYEALENSVNKFITQNKRIIKNVLKNADQETLDIVANTILLSLGLGKDKNGSERMDLKYTVFSNILAGGIVYYLLWHVENNFQSDVLNIYLYDLIKTLCTWESEEIQGR